MDSESRFNELRRYVRFDEVDASLLAALRPFVAPHFERIAREFYERLREHEDAHAVFTGEAQILRLHRSFVGWLDRLFSGIYDEAYYARTFAIGQAHVRAGLPQRYMFTSMALVRCALDAIVDASLAERAPATRTALSRLLDLELAVMLEGYRENLERHAERRNDLAVRDHADALAIAERYEAALDAIPCAVVGLDDDGVVRLFNAEASGLTALAYEEAIGEHFVDVMVAPDLRSRDRDVVDALLGGGPKRLEHASLLATRSGRVRDIRWTFVRLAETKGDVALIAFGEDVTEAHATTERVHRKEKLATIGTLVAGLAHEIRNPLNSAALHLTVLDRAARSSGANDEVLEAASVVNGQIARLSQLLTEFLELARPQPVERRPVDVRDLVRRVYERTTPRAATVGVTVELDLPAQALVSSTDSARIERVIASVLDNAVEAVAPRGFGTVKIRARRSPRYVEIEIEDDGPGVPAGAPVFDPFFSTKPSGTGLGLAIAHRIITDHDGTISVETRDGRTRFRFTLPTNLGSPGPDGGAE